MLAFILTLSYLQRVPGALFGLDQVNAMTALYLMLAPCGARFSVDAWLRGRGRGGLWTVPAASVMANIATRLLQSHLCVIYFFSAVGKLQGVSWWEGTAVWLAVANYEYQSVDLTWLWRYPWLINGLTQATVLLELSYVALIWPRTTRPLILLAVCLMHLGIACCLGLATFGWAMIFANLAFVSPTLLDGRNWRRPVSG